MDVFTGIGGAEMLSFTARVPGGFAHSFGNMKK